MYGGAQVLDSRSDVVRRLGLQRRVRATPTRCCGPTRRRRRSCRGSPATRGSSAPPTRSTARRASRRRASCCERVLDTRAEMGYGIKTGMEYENYFLNRGRHAAVRRVPHLQPGPQRLPPGRARPARDAAEGRRRPDHGQRGVRPGAVRAQLRAGRRAGRAPTRATRTRTPSRRSRTSTADRHVHVEADQRRWPAAARTSTSRCSTPTRASRSWAPTTRSGACPTSPKPFVAGNLKYAKDDLHAARADGQLHEAPAAAHLRAVEHLVGPSRTARR